MKSTKKIGYGPGISPKGLAETVHNDALQPEGPCRELIMRKKIDRDCQHARAKIGFHSKQHVPKVRSEIHRSEENRPKN